jgi:hypothetical protein
MPLTEARWTGGIWLSSADMTGLPWRAPPLQQIARRRNGEDGGGKAAKKAA